MKAQEPKPEQEFLKDARTLLEVARTYQEHPESFGSEVLLETILDLIACVIESIPDSAQKEENAQLRKRIAELEASSADLVEALMEIAYSEPEAAITIARYALEKVTYSCVVCKGPCQGH